jgi:hypothetical protein
MMNRTKHTIIEKLLGKHQWRETYRDSSLFDEVQYICTTCAERKERWEHPERGQLSLDPIKRKEQEIKARKEADKWANR